MGIMEMPAVLGISACQEEEWKYWIGVCTSKEAEPPLEILELPAATWAIFPGTGAMPKACQELEKRIFTEWLPTSGYTYGKGADIEVYYNADPTDSVFEIWIPVVKKQKIFKETKGMYLFVKKRRMPSVFVRTGRIFPFFWTFSAFA